VKLYCETIIIQDSMIWNSLSPQTGRPPSVQWFCNQFVSSKWDCCLWCGH